MQLDIAKYNTTSQALPHTEWYMTDVYGNTSPHTGTWPKRKQIIQTNTRTIQLKLSIYSELGGAVLFRCQPFFGFT